MTFFSQLGCKQGRIFFIFQIDCLKPHVLISNMSNFSFLRALACINQEKKSLLVQRKINSSSKIYPHREL